MGNAKGKNKQKKDINIQHDGLKDEPWREESMKKLTNKMKLHQNASLNSPQKGGLGDSSQGSLPIGNLR